MDKENLHAGHFKRMKHLFLKAPSMLYEHQLVEVFLILCKQRRDMNPVAHRLINTFGNFCGILKAPKEELLKVKGVSPRVADVIVRFSNTIRYLNSHDYEASIPIKDEYAFLDKYQDKILELKEHETLMVFLNRDRELQLCSHLPTRFYHNRNFNMSKFIMGVMAKLNISIIMMGRYTENENYNPSDSDIIEIKELYTVLRLSNVLLYDYIVLMPNGKKYSYKEHNIFNILGALLYNDHNFIHEELTKKDVQIKISDNARKVKGNYSDTDRIVIASCRHIYGSIILDIFN